MRRMTVSARAVMMMDDVQRATSGEVERECIRARAIRVSLGFSVPNGSDNLAPYIYIYARESREVRVDKTSREMQVDPGN